MHTEYNELEIFPDCQKRTTERERKWNTKKHWIFRYQKYLEEVLEMAIKKMRTDMKTLLSSSNTKI